MPCFDALLLDYGNTVVQFDRPQIEWIHGRLAQELTRIVGPIEAAELGAVMDRVCVQQQRSADLREFTPVEQMDLVLREVFGAGTLVTPRMVEDADQEYQDLFVRSIEVDGHTVPVLERLHRRVRLGLVSNYPCGESLRRSLDATGVTHLFDPVVVSGEVGYVKPHPKLFQVALEALGLAPERVLFVGDNWAVDLLGASAAGMATCHYLGHTSEMDHEGRYESYRPDFLIRHLTELEEIVGDGAGGGR